MSGWCVADLFDLTPKERLFCMAAASVADVDGLGILVSQDAYLTYHHLLGHNLWLAPALANHRRMRYGGIDLPGEAPSWPICMAGSSDAAGRD